MKMFRCVENKIEMRVQGHLKRKINLIALEIIRFDDDHKPVSRFKTGLY